MHRFPLSVPLLLALGCTVGDPNFDKDLRGTADADTAIEDTGDTETGDADTDTDTDDSGEDPKEYNFDDPGDWVDFASTATPEQVSLEDESGELNQDQQFYLVLVNNAESDQTFGLRYGAASSIVDGPPAPKVAPPPRDEVLIAPALYIPRRDAMDTADIGSLQDVFRVRNDLTDTDSYDVKDATLWGLGDNVAIWVDNEVPIDWDFECDGVIDQPHQYNSYGFDNCDLTTIADIIDLNIFPNVTAMFGDVSDIDEDGRVDVFITPELNALPQTSTDDEDWDRVVPSYAEPSVDLQDYDIKTNPGSDQREVIYVYAPDPEGFLNPGAKVPIERYTNYSVAAEVARSLVSLISYYQHSEAGGSSVEEDWLNDVLGTMAADRCGFGAQFHLDAWKYLDAPHYYALVGEAAKGSLDTREVGAQYLFALWLYQYVQEAADNPSALLAAIVQTDTTGIDSINAALASDANLGDYDFDDIVVHWQFSTLMSGVSKSDGTAMLKGDLVAYPPPETLSSPPASRDNLYGANGYQRGLSLNSTNYAYSGGHTDDPAVIDGSEMKLENTDPYHFDPAFDYDGLIAGGYGATVVRLDGIPYDQASLEIHFSGSGFVGGVVRWEDPTEPDYAVENIYGATEVNPVYLPPLPSDGTVVYGLGEITSPGRLTVIDTEGNSSTAEVPDTDRWLLDLTDRRPGVTVPVAVWLDRRVDSTGKSTPESPWIAVAPVDWVPLPTVADTHYDPTCSGAAEFSYPTSLLEYLYYQNFLSSTIGSDSGDFDGCGVAEASLPSCDTDWDRDWVLDASEPVPTTFFEQVLTEQCTFYGGSLPSGVDAYTEDWLDWEELDEDDDPYYDIAANVGGRSGEDDEEAFIYLELDGGQQYILVVGAGGEGLYELSFRAL